MEIVSLHALDSDSAINDKLLDMIQSGHYSMPQRQIKAAYSVADLSDRSAPYCPELL